MKGNGDIVTLDAQAWAIVRDLAEGGVPAYYDAYQDRICIFCGREISFAPDALTAGHLTDCLYVRARQAVERLDAARQPVEAHIRFSRALNRGHRRTEG